MNPSIGRIVHYITADVDGVPGLHRAAIVASLGLEPGVVNLHVFWCPEDDAFGDPEQSHIENVSEGAGEGTWHWPEREG